MHPISAVLTLVLISVILFSQRRTALLGIIAGVLYLSQFQAIDVLGTNMMAHRFLALAGLVRIVVRKEFSLSQFNSIDKMLLLAYGYATLVFLMRSDVGITRAVGSLLDVSFFYVVFRGLVTSIEDLEWFLKGLAICLAPYMVLLYIEMSSNQNPFELIDSGAAGELTGRAQMYRGDRVRALGSFRHPSLLGTLGASLLPIYIGLFCIKRNRAGAVWGIAFALAIVWLSNSGGPVSAAGIAIVGWLLWGMRTRMFIVRRMFGALVVFLLLMMKAPIWYLPAKLSSITGGGGWHRSYLMDVFMQNFEKWWLAGMSITQTRDWFPYHLHVTGGADITNQYVSMGLNGGLLALVLFILLIIQVLRVNGNALAATRRTLPIPDEAEYLLWGLGCAVFAHAFNFLAITYFDQVYIVWLMQIAAISSISQSYLDSKT